MAVRREAPGPVDLADVTANERQQTVTPDEVPDEGFVAPRGLSVRALVRETEAPPNRIRAVTAEAALLLARRLCTSAKFRMNPQTAQDLERAYEAEGTPSDARPSHRFTAAASSRKR